MINSLIKCDCGRQILDIDLQVNPDGTHIRCEKCQTPPALQFITKSALADMKLAWELEVHPASIQVNGKRHYTL